MNNLTENGLPFSLCTGELHLSLKKKGAGEAEFCGAAARANPKRRFVFVSKVLGRYTTLKRNKSRMAKAIAA